MFINFIWYKIINKKWNNMRKLEIFILDAFIPVCNT
jgi:hypothetical protein